MNAVFKYPVTLNGTTSVPRHAEFLKVGFQGDQLFVWALVDLNFQNDLVPIVESVFTGRYFERDLCPHFRYYGTFIDSCGLVQHIFTLRPLI